jgi:8-oxo-dGTP pyrophosphatase MutT (NUDIX family)
VQLVCGEQADAQRGDSAPSQVVVGAAIVDDGRLLAARRTHPPATAGGWELPGGKVEPGEDLAAAAVREVAEELDCEVEVQAVLPRRQPIRAGYELRVAVARLVRGTPSPHEHDAIRWLGPDQLDQVAWLPADLPFLPDLRLVLGDTQTVAHDDLPGHAADAGLREADAGHRPVPTRRAVLFEAEHAEAVAARLAAGGFAAEVTRERLAGEDDDEDHPWAVDTDAPALVVEVLADEFDGWVDELDSHDRVGPGADGPGTGSAAPSAPGPAPLDLPQGPRRIKRGPGR